MRFRINMPATLAVCGKRWKADVPPGMVRTMGILRSLRRTLAALLLALCWLPTARATPPAGYWLAWSDECNSNDTAKFDNWLPGARRDAINTGSAITHSNGIRTITTWTSNGTHYTGMISTQGRFQERYGFWEAYVDYNGATGMWSAFWMQSPTMGNPIGDPATAGSEIDICEHRSYDDGGSFIATGYDINNHWDGYGADHKSVGSRRNVGNANTGFHTYGLLWDESEYQFYYDNAWQWTTTQGHSRRSEFAILSSEVENGAWAGNIPTGGYGPRHAPIAKMQIDYVHWYAPSNYTIWDGGGTNASWADTGNWVAGRTPNAGRVVVFDGFTRTNFTVVLDANRSIAGIVVTEPSDVVTLASNVLTLGADGIDMEMNSHSLTFDCRVNMAAAQAWDVGQWNLTANSMVGGGYSITKTGAGNLILNASNTYTGGTTIREGTLLIGHGYALGSTSANTRIADGARLLLNANLTCPEDLALAGTGTDGNGALRVGASADVVWDGRITLTNDTLVKLDGNTTLALNDSVSISNFTLSLAGDGRSVGTLAGPVTGAGWIVKSGGGTWSITSHQPLGGTHLYVDAGTLNLNGASATSTTWCGAGSVSNSSGTLAVTNGARLACGGDFNIADVTGSRGILHLANGSTLLPNTFYVGKWGNATGTVNQNGGTVTNFDATPGDWRIGGGNSTNDHAAFGRYNMDAGVFHTTANLQIGAYGDGEWLQSGGVATVGAWPVVGRFTGSAGLLSVSNGVFNQTGSVQRLIIGEQGTGTLILANSGQVNLAGGLFIGQGAASRGTVHLNGGTLSTPLLLSTGGVSMLNWNGGVVRATASSTNFIAGIDTATVLSGGAILDSNGQTVRVAQAFGGIGRFVKTGDGALTLAASNSFAGGILVSAGVLRVATPFATGTGTVTVTANGTLGGTGRVAGAVVLAGVMDPGFSVGTLPTGPQTWTDGSGYRFEIASAISATGSDRLAVSGAITVSATAGNPFMLRIVTLSNGVAGKVPDFDNRTAYQWIVATASGGFSGFSTSAVMVDAGAFSNSLAGGTFALGIVATTNLVLAYSPPLPPAQTSMGMGALNGISIGGQGVAGLRYHLEGATNLASPAFWQPITNAAAGTNGLFVLPDTSATNLPVRFYRVRETQP